MTEREQFEVWCALDNPRYRPWDDGIDNRRDWKVWQASRKQALEAVLPKSYGGSTFSSWGDQKDGCTIRLHFTDAQEAEAWFSRITDQSDAIRALTHRTHELKRQEGKEQ